MLQPMEVSVLCCGGRLIWCIFRVLQDIASPQNKENNYGKHSLYFKHHCHWSCFCSFVLVLSETLVINCRCVISPYFHWYTTKISVNTVNSSITNCLIKRGRFQKASNVYRWWKTERIDYLCVTSPSSYVTWYCYQYCLCYITCVMWPSPPRLWCCCCCCCCMATRRHCPGAKW